MGDKLKDEQQGSLHISCFLLLFILLLILLLQIFHCHIFEYVNNHQKNNMYRYAFFKLFEINFFYGS
jgi:hypothetical protein